MKNLKKVLAVMTAVSAMAATTSAFAATTTTATVTPVTSPEGVAGVTGTYVNTAATGEAAVYKLSVDTPALADLEQGDMTLLVLKEGTTAVDDTAILYIDQGDGFSNMGLKTLTIGEGESAVLKEVNEVATEGNGHIIKVGYYDADKNFYIAEGNLKITITEDGPVIEYIDLQLGDCADLGGTVDVSDITAAVKHMLGNPLLTGNYLLVANADQDTNGSVDVSDITAMVKHMLGTDLLGKIQVQK